MYRKAEKSALVFKEVINKAEWVKVEHSITPIIAKSQVNANHNEAQNAAFRRRCRAYRRRQNLDAKITINQYLIFHQLSQVKRLDLSLAKTNHFGVIIADRSKIATGYSLPETHPKDNITQNLQFSGHSAKLTK